MLENYRNRSTIVASALLSLLCGCVVVALYSWDIALAGDYDYCQQQEVSVFSWVADSCIIFIHHI